MSEVDTRDGFHDLEGNGRLVVAGHHVNERTCKQRRVNSIMVFFIIE